MPRGSSPRLPSNDMSIRRALHQRKLQYIGSLPETLVVDELGLAHAAKKPVVFAAGHLEDVPFDLRHLRVIVYEVREPDWATKLKAAITDYVRNAAKEPAKSIPHPFRSEAQTEGASA